MGIYEDLGIEKVVNAAGPATRLGGPRMAPEAARAMREAAEHCVPIDHLQAKAGSIIADLLGTEAGYVTSGASAGLTLATAACLTGLDLARMESLPVTAGRPNEVIICREQRNGYDHAIRAAGAVLVEVGVDELGSGAGARRAETWEIEQAISERTAAVAYFATPRSEPALEEVIAVTQRRGVPLILDVAGQLPPASNLRRYGASGADAVVFSGGKAIRGPQGTGILAGRRDLIMAAALQNLDMDEHPSTWDPPDSLIDVARIPGIPRHGIGRGYKVSKEEIVGLIVALKAFASGENMDHLRECGRHLDRIVAGLNEIPGTRIHRQDASEPGGYPLVEITLDRGPDDRSAMSISRKLKQGNPAVYVAEYRLRYNALVIHPIGLNDEDVDILIERLGDVLSDGEVHHRTA